MGTDIHASFHYRKKDEANETETWEFCDHNYDGNRQYRLFAWLADVRNGVGFAGCDTGDAIKPLAEPRGLPEDNIYWPEPAHEYSYRDPAWTLYWNNGGGEYGDHSKSWLTSTEILEGMAHLNDTKARGVMSLAQFHKWDKVSEPKSYSGGVFGKGCVTVSSESAKLIPVRHSTYADALENEIRRGQRKAAWVTRFEKIRITEEDAANRKKGIYSHTQLNGRPWWLPPSLSAVMVDFYERKRVLKTSKSKRKHQAKLRKYQERVGRVNVKCEWTVPATEMLERFKYFTDEVQRLHDLHGEVRMVFGFDS